MTKVEASGANVWSELLSGSNFQVPLKSGFGVGVGWLRLAMTYLL